MRSIFTILWLCLSISCLSQKEASNWFFGIDGGIRFNSSGVSASPNNYLNAFEGCAVISDKTGHVLFYTDGIRVLNSAHTIMKNGLGLAGAASSTQNALIVPQPGYDSLFYIFTIDAAFGTRGLNYSIVNMHGDNGMGEVISKNIHLLDSTCEKITAVRHCDRNGVWVTVRKIGTDKYYTYGVSIAGITGPVISSCGHNIPNNTNGTIGAMKFASDGRQMAAVYGYENDIVELMDFNNKTGVLSNPNIFRVNTNIPTLGTPGLYGVEFSPSGNFLYLTSVSLNNSSFLFQVDLTSGSAAAIAASVQTTATLFGKNFGALQLALDQKIYVSIWEDNYVGVIQSPDVSGSGCNFLQMGILLGQLPLNRCQGGLPSFIQSYFRLQDAPYDFTRDGDCSDPTTHFSISPLANIDSVLWDFGDGNPSRNISPFHTFPGVGLYPVQLTIYKTDCSTQAESISRNILVTRKNFLGTDTSFCSMNKLRLGYTVSEATYLWNTGATSANINVPTSGIYWMELEQNGCRLRDSVNIDAKPLPVVKLGNDTGICISQTLRLDAGNIGSTYKWNTGETTSYINVALPGIYSVIVTSNGCQSADDIKVDLGGCKPLIPTAFTPNNDGINDLFGILDSYGISAFEFTVFDRWGRKIFHSLDKGIRWNGRYKGDDMPSGVYSWIIKYTDLHGEVKMEKGIVTLIR